MPRAAKKAAAKRPAGKAPTPFVAAAVGQLVEGLDIDGDDRALALAALAVNLARQLDDGAGMASAAVSKELRATLKELGGDGDDDELDAWQAGLGEPELPS